MLFDGTTALDRGDAVAIARPSGFSLRRIEGLRRCSVGRERRFGPFFYARRPL